MLPVSHFQKFHDQTVVPDLYPYGWVAYHSPFENTVDITITDKLDVSKKYRLLILPPAPQHLRYAPWPPVFTKLTVNPSPYIRRLETTLLSGSALDISRAITRKIKRAKTVKYLNRRYYNECTSAMKSALFFYAYCQSEARKAHIPDMLALLSDFDDDSSLTSHDNISSLDDNISSLETFPILSDSDDSQIDSSASLSEDDLFTPSLPPDISNSVKLLLAAKTFQQNPPYIN
jgi:hypothetical protein